MEYEVRKFTNEQFGGLTTVTIDGSPWFIGKQVAMALGYNTDNKGSALAHAITDHVDSEDQIMLNYDQCKALFKPDENKQVKISRFGMKIINESGLYSLIISSKAPSAKAFKHWITSEVLPTLRKTGTYSIVPNSNTDSYMIEDPIERAKAWIAEQEERNRLATENKSLIEENKNLISEYYDIKADREVYRIQLEDNKEYTCLGRALVASEKSCTIAEVAALLAKRGCKSNGRPISRNAFFKLLRDHKFLKTTNGRNQPTQAAINAGILELVIKVYIGKDGKIKRYAQTMVTPKGQKFFLSRWEQACDR